MKHDITSSPQEILDWITNSPKLVTYDYIIMGKSGPTGKTWLYSKLKERGYNTTELSEYIMGKVVYAGEINHLIINDLDRKIIIILNKPLEKRNKMNKTDRKLIGYSTRIEGELCVGVISAKDIHEAKLQLEKSFDIRNIDLDDLQEIKFDETDDNICELYYGC